MISKELIHKILEISINAPSGSNSQPWRFEIRGNQIDIFALPEMENPVLNFRDRGTLMAHGALLENIIIVSSVSGYIVDYDIFPTSQDKNLTIKLFLQEAPKGENPLFRFIASRTTNRKPYDAQPLTAREKKELFDIIKGTAEVETRIIEDKRIIEQIAEAESKGEAILFGNYLLHKSFFEKVVWSRREEQKKGRAFYVKTKELKTVQQLAFRLFRYWPIMSFFNKFGMAKLIAETSSKKYATSSAMGIFLVEDKDESFIHVGRLMQRLWLTATKLGLSFQLLTLVPFLWQRVNLGEAKYFSKRQVDLIDGAYQEIASLFGATGEKRIIASLFRVGWANPPTAQSAKKPPEILFKN